MNIIRAPDSVTKPLKLVLASYEAANWKISVPSGGQIQDIHVVGISLGISIGSYFRHLFAFDKITALGN